MQAKALLLSSQLFSKGEKFPLDYYLVSRFLPKYFYWQDCDREPRLREKRVEWQGKAKKAKKRQMITAKDWKGGAGNFFFNSRHVYSIVCNWRTKCVTPFSIDSTFFVHIRATGWDYTVGYTEIFWNFLKLLNPNVLKILKSAHCGPPGPLSS